MFPNDFERKPEPKTQLKTKPKMHPKPCQSRHVACYIRFVVFSFFFAIVSSPSRVSFTFASPLEMRNVIVVAVGKVIYLSSGYFILSFPAQDDDMALCLFTLG